MKTIIVPTDFSECSEAALPYAALIAKKTGAQILFIHILQVPQVITRDLPYLPYMVNLVREVKSNMKKLMSKPLLEGIEISNAIIKTGSISRRVNEIVKKHKADMIVMATHGASGWHELFVGSNAERIVRDAEVPVLSVKENNNNPKLETIVFASDFLEEYKRVFPVVKEIAEALNVKLNLVKVFSGIDFGTTREKQNHILGFKRWTYAFDHPVFIYYDDSREHGISQYANSVHADMIALGTHGRHGLSHFFNGSIAENLANHSSLPVLTIKIHKESLPALNGKTIEQPKQKENQFMHQIPAM